MSRDVGVTLLISLVLLDIVQIVPSDDDCAVHLRALHLAAQNSSANGYISRKWALVVDVCALDSLLGGLEAQANSFVPPAASLARSLSSLTGHLLVTAK